MEMKKMILLFVSIFLHQAQSQLWNCGIGMMPQRMVKECKMDNPDMLSQCNDSTTTCVSSTLLPGPDAGICCVPSPGAYQGNHAIFT